MTTVAKLSTGDSIAGKYQIERVLGEGGMATVFAATHLELEERVAIKVLLPELAARPDVVGRFMREARAAVRIRGEHVVRVRDVGRLESGAPYMVMEYLDGADLGVLVAERAVPFETACEYVLQACEAVASAHSLGIVHRDIKPQNLFLTTRDDGSACIKVLDFGISKVTGSKTDPSVRRTDAALGTPLYMAPEQMSSSGTVDSRADIWALGVTLYELCAGSPPFEGLPSRKSASPCSRTPRCRSASERRTSPRRSASSSCGAWRRTRRSAGPTSASWPRRSRRSFRREPRRRLGGRHRCSSVQALPRSRA